MFTYDPKDVSVTLNGKIVTGFAEGSMVSCAKDEENFQTKVSAKGEVYVAKTNNPLGTITLTLSQSSPFVNQCNKWANAGTVIPAWVNCKKPTSEKLGGTKAIIKKPADAEFSDDMGDREFEIQVFNYSVS